ncbi:MAG: hypothetical protein WDN04_17335 [Rhodospirillales bacterium]
MSALTAEVQPGEHVLIEGAPAVCRRLLQVIAGLWPWGDGTVLMPVGANCFFVTERPYLPIGELAGVVCYPASLGVCEPAAIVEALQRVGLSELTDRLLEVDDWERTLTLAQQQRLSFARLLLHRPDWVFLADATNAMDEDGHHDIAALLREEFAGSAVLAVDTNGVFDGFFQRTLRIEPARTAA